MVDPSKFKQEVQVDTSPMQQAFKDLLKHSHFTSEEFLKFQAVGLAMELNKRFGMVVTPEKIKSEMMASVQGGKGYKRKTKKYDGSALKVALGTGSTALVAATLARSGKKWKAFLRRNMGDWTSKRFQANGQLIPQEVLSIESQNRMRGKGGRVDFKKAKRGEIQKIMFEAEFRRRVGRIGYQASGWLAAIYKWGNKGGQKVKTVQFLQGSEGWADASGRKSVAMSTKTGRVLERYSGPKKQITLVNYSNGIMDTEGKYNIVAAAVAARIKNMYDHLRDKLGYDMRESGFKSKA